MTRRWQGSFLSTPKKILQGFPPENQFAGEGSHPSQQKKEMQECGGGVDCKKKVDVG
jgi:hypothetical protein